jgi:hypothetical protein
MKFPKVIYITQDPNAEDDDSFLAWGTMQSADAGKVASYQLVEVAEKRDTFELRRDGTKTWFKP